MPLLADISEHKAVNNHSYYLGVKHIFDYYVNIISDIETTDYSELVKKVKICIICYEPNLSMILLFVDVCHEDFKTIYHEDCISISHNLEELSYKVTNKNNFFDGLTLQCRMSTVKTYDGQIVCTVAIGFDINGNQFGRQNHTVNDYTKYYKSNKRKQQYFDMYSKIYSNCTTFVKFRNTMRNELLLPRLAAARKYLADIFNHYSNVVNKTGTDEYNMLVDKIKDDIQKNIQKDVFFIYHKKIKAENYDVTLTHTTQDIYIFTSSEILKYVNFIKINDEANYFCGMKMCIQLMPIYSSSFYPKYVSIVVYFVKSNKAIDNETLYEYYKKWSDSI